MKKAKKTFLAEVVIRQWKKDSNIPDFGLGTGVLMQQEISFNDDQGRGFETPLFTMALLKQEGRLLKETVEVRWTEIKKKKK